MIDISEKWTDISDRAYKMLEDNMEKKEYASYIGVKNFEVMSNVTYILGMPTPTVRMFGVNIVPTRRVNFEEG